MVLRKTKFDIHEASMWYGGDLLIADGFDEAIIGIEDTGEEPRVCYSKQKCIEILMEEGCDELEAIEHLEYNTFSAYVGAKTPLWIDDQFLREYSDSKED